MRIFHSEYFRMHLDLDSITAITDIDRRTDYFATFGILLKLHNDPLVMHQNNTMGVIDVNDLRVAFERARMEIMEAWVKAS